MMQQTVTALILTLCLLSSTASAGMMSADMSLNSNAAYAESKEEIPCHGELQNPEAEAQCCHKQDCSNCASGNAILPIASPLNASDHKSTDHGRIVEPLANFTPENLYRPPIIS